MNKPLKITLITVGVIVAGVAAWILATKTRKDSSDGSGSGSETDGDKKQRFQDVQKNLGVSTDGNVLTVNFMAGQNQADFYDNGRFFISKKGVPGYLKKGSYFNGGKRMVIDGGATIEGESVWNNLQKTLS